MGRRRAAAAALSKVLAWVRRRSAKVKTLLAAAFALCALVALKHLVKNHAHFFVVSEAVHFAGILVLIYKLTTQKTCSGLSLKTQELTAIFLAARLCCSYSMESNIHTFLDFATLMSTLWVIYMIRFKLKATYVAELDNMPLYYVAVPSAILAVLIHPYTHNARLARILWAFAVYLESVSVLPQLRMIQNTKMIEPFTAHYVFALSVARFLGCAHWIIQLNATSHLFPTCSGPWNSAPNINQSLFHANTCRILTAPEQVAQEHPYVARRMHAGAPNSGLSGRLAATNLGFGGPNSVLNS
ncbi:ER lumen protein-retaining receptor [Sesamum alatum]|uniref:ER lumen protein-retaining receptor n=1 Tax=Sesamum alatum TaxID=300844 RepID=A0AAE1Z2W5_9LAMI|nr:ER lumen protein-retaining receptor [Sesamum alatum]